MIQLYLHSYTKLLISYYTYTITYKYRYN